MIDEKDIQPQQKNSFLRFLPFIIFFIFSIIALIRITTRDGNDPTTLPDVLSGKIYPETSLPLLLPAQDAPQIFNPDDFKGRVTLINFWGSWCPPCREEHPVLLELAKDNRFDLVGINYKDNKENAIRFLGTFGNPFSLIGVDQNGRTAIDWGVYGPPETFLINKQGIITYKYIGPLTSEALQKDLMPQINKALAE